MKTHLLILSPLLLLMVVGCKKKDDPSPSIKLVSQISTFDGTKTDVTIVKYDDRNRLISDSNDVKKAGSKYVYDNNDRMIERTTYYHALNINDKSNQREVFDYTAKPGSIIATLFLNGVQSKYVDEYILNAKQQVSRINFGWDGGGKYTLFTYDEKGNLLVQADHMDRLLTITYDHDQHKGASSDIKKDIYNIIGTRFNNVVHEKFNGNYSVPPSSNDTMVTYTYNSDDMPATSTEVTTFTYNNKITDTRTRTSTYTYISK